MQGSTARRGALVGVFAALALGAAAPAALGATVTGNEDYFFTANPGETNVVTITRSGNTVTFDDAGSDLTAGGPDCTEGANDVVTCTSAPGGNESVTVDLGDLNDTLTVIAPAEDPLNDLFDTSVDAGAGDDTVNMPVDAGTADGGDGNDTINGGNNIVDQNASSETLSGGAGDDTVNGNGGADTLRGNDGNDTLDGGADDDSLNGGAGNDQERGGDGDDGFAGGPAVIFFSGDPGADNLVGGPGIDAVSYNGTDQPDPMVFTFTNIALNVTLDGQANDGAPGEGDNAQVEDVSFIQFSANEVASSFVGDANANSFSGGNGNDTVDGGAGNDILATNAGKDTIRARDGFADRVFCGTEVDTAQVDGFDQLGSGCETVDSAQTPFATEDLPPSIAFVSPANGAVLNTTAPTPITVTASDDKAVARVLLIDDGAIVGQSTTAPYTIPYQPRGGDVGKNQLAVVAVDSSGQTTTAFRTVTVNRFTPRSVSVRFSPSRDRTLPYRFTTSGSVNLPAGGLVTREQGCKGIVSVQVKKGSKTISTRRATLRSNCTYSSTVVFRDTRRTGRRGTLKVTVRFLGNEVLARRSAASRNYRVGR